VFVGGCTQEPAESVGGAGDIDMLDGIASVVDESLVREVDGPDGEPRFTMLETIREYALEQLDASDEAEQMRRRHAEYFAQFAEGAEAKLLYATDADWFNRVDAEHDNIRAALAWCSGVADAVDLMARLANPLWIFWWLRGHWAEAARWYDRILELPVGSGWRIGALRGRGQIAVQAGDYALAAACWDEGAALARQLGDLKMVSTLVGRRAHAAGQLGDTVRGMQLAEEALAIAEQLGSGERIALAWNEVGNVARASGDIDRAREAHEEALRRAREIGLGFYVPYALQALAGHAIDRGDLAGASTLINETLPLVQRRDDRWGTIFCLRHLARIARRTGERDRVGALAREAISLSQAIGTRPPIIECLGHLAWVARVDGLPERAAVLAGAAVAVLESTGLRGSTTPRDELVAEIAVLKEALGAAAFEATWNEGRAMSADRAVRYALEEMHSPRQPSALPHAVREPI
jgi:tetratricopeptide (TPR) repeat protein